jgi:asparagine synthase (glutamine-hydrolysing)
VPFLDHELWEFMARLPAPLLLAGAPKDLLRAAMQPLLPPAILARSKQGLAAPYGAWLRRARLPDWAEAALSPEALQRTGYFMPAVVANLRAEHRAGRLDHARRLMGVLSTQLWHDQFLA